MKFKNLPEYIYDKLSHSRISNPYIRQACYTNICNKDVSVYLCGKGINPATRDLIESAEEEVLMQFFKYEDASDASRDIRAALLSLNKKNKPIHIKLMIDHLIGPGGWALKGLQNPFTWLQERNGVYYFENESGEHHLKNLKIEIKMHEHLLCNTYHVKQVIVDRKRFMIRSGDVSSDTDYLQNQDGRREMAHIINNEELAQHAAHSFEKRFATRGSRIKKFYKNDEGPPEKKLPILLIEKEASSDPLKRLLFTSGFKKALITAYDASETKIQIATPNLNDHEIIDALVRAIKRGVRVEVVMGKYHNQGMESVPTMGGSNFASVQKIYSALPISYWDQINIRWARDAKLNLIQDQATTTMHCKLVIIDDEVVLSGSSPQDIQATYYSAESDFVIQSPDVAHHDQQNVFSPLYEAGLDVHDEKLKMLKESLIVDIKRRLFIDDIHLFKVNDYDNLTQKKVTAITNIIANIENCSTFKDLISILQAARKVDESNPLAYMRRKLPFNFFHKKIGKTATIVEFEELYKIYVERKERLKVFEDHTHRIK